MTEDHLESACSASGQSEPRSPLKTVVGVLVLAAAVALGVYSLANRPAEAETEAPADDSAPAPRTDPLSRGAEQDTAAAEQAAKEAGGCGCERGGAAAPAAAEQPSCGEPAGPACCAGGGG